MEDSRCESYLRSKNIVPDTDVVSIVSKLLRADPDQNSANCEWIIDSYLNGYFRIDEDEPTVRESIIEFKELYGDRRPLPKKGYSELKIMIRDKLEKSQKKSKAKERSIAITKEKSKAEREDCRTYFDYSFPGPHSKLETEQLNLLFQKILEINPTNDIIICTWIVKELKRKNIEEKDLDEVGRYLEKYLKLGFPLPNFYLNFKDINNYQLVKDAVDKNVELLHVSDLGILLTPRTKETACYYGVNTKWCTARRDEDNMYKKYASKGDIFIWFDNKIKNKFQFHFEELQIMDRLDDPISKERFKEFLNHPVLKFLFDEFLEKIKKSELSINIINFIENFDPTHELISFEALKNIEIKTKNPKLIYEYIWRIIKGPWPKSEDLISNDSKVSFDYAKEILKTRFPKGEEAILKDVKFATKYKRLFKLN
jgi:hypothetical protein